MTLALALLPTKVCAKCGETLPATADFFYRDNRRTDGLQGRCKDCRRAFYLEHQDSLLLYAKTWRDEHKDELAVYFRTHYEANKEAKAAYDRAYREANAERIAQRTKQYRELNKELESARHKAYREAHPDRIAALNRNRKAKKKSSDGIHTAADVEAQYSRQHGRCFYCNKKVGKDYHVDHVIPLAKGGGNGPENLVVACPKCNLSKHDKHPMDFCGRLL
jgi:5-methylcytosine-specific restriction endonuclease McrA